MEEGAGGDADKPGRRRRKLNSLERGKLRDSIRGSKKFQDSKHDLGVIRDCIRDLEIESEQFSLKNTKPVIKFYGSYNEMLSLLMLRQGGLDKKADHKVHSEAFKADPAHFSFVETGQEVPEESFDENMIDLTPDSKGIANTIANQTASGGFTAHVAQFKKVKSRVIQDFCK